MTTDAEPGADHRVNTGSGAAVVAGLRALQAQKLVRDVARFLRFYGGGVAGALATPYGWFTALVDEIPRLSALEKRDAIDVHYTKDPQWLADRCTAISHSGMVTEIETVDYDAEWERLGALLGR